MQISGFIPIKKLFFTSIIGLIVALNILQQSEFIKDLVTQKILASQAFENVDIKFRISKINLFSQKIELANVLFHDHKNRWSVAAKTMSFTFNWLNLITKREFNTNLVLKNAALFSKIKDNKLKIVKQFKKFFLLSSETLKVNLLSLNLIDGTIQVIDEQNNITANGDLKLKLLNIKNEYNLNAELNDGKISQDANPFACLHSFHSIDTNGQFRRSPRGSVAIGGERIYEQNILTQIKALIQAKIPLIKPSNSECNIQGSLIPEKFKDLHDITFECKIKNQILDLNLQNQDKTFNIENIKIDIRENFQADINATTSMVYIKFLNQKLENLIYQGIAKIDATFLKDKIFGSINIKSPNFLKLQLDEIKIAFNKTKDLNANFVIKKENLKFAGFCDLKEEKTFSMFIHNRTQIFDPFKKFFIKPGELKLRATSKDLNLFKANLKSLIFNRDNIENPSNFDLNCKVINEKVDFNGLINNYLFKGFLNLNSQLKLDNIVLTEKDSNKSVLSCSCKENNIKATIDCEIIKKIVPFNTNSFTGKCKVHLNCNITKKNKFKGKLFLTDCSILIPNSYSIIKNIKFNFKFSPQKKLFKINNFVIELNKGSIECKSGQIKFDDFLKQPIFIYFPIIVKGLNLNLSKEIITTISSRLLVKKDIDKIKPEISGDITIQNLFLNNLEESFLSSQKAANLFLPDIDLNLNIINLKPIKLKNGQLKSNAYANIKIKGTLTKPSIFGAIELSSGKIKFPYKNLKIKNGKITIQDSDVQLDINAQNKVKNYHIYAHIYGDAKNPTISLSSNPSLDENQIGSLLIAGTKDASLNTIVPSLIIQNLQNLIFKQTKEVLFKDKNPILKQLKNIKLISTINEEQNGSIKGGVEINLSDKLHAQIQQNISKQTTDIEIDYAITDDISIRGIKDEDGDLAGEVEFKWRV